MKFSYDKAEEYCKNLDSVNQNILNLLDDMKSEVSKFYGLNIWEGRDADYFLGKFRSLSDNIVKLSDQLDRSGKYVKSCSNRYLGLEEAIQTETKNWYEEVSVDGGYKD